MWCTENIWGSKWTSSRITSPLVPSREILAAIHKDLRKPEAEADITEVCGNAFNDIDGV
jgi:hypothetical protein